MFKVDYHGDDYAVSVNNSKRMIELIKMGKLDSISIIPNMAAFDECMIMLKNEWASFDKKPLISVHINLIDGISLSGSKNPVMVNEKGNLSSSWGKYFIKSFIPGKGRKLLKEDLTQEIKEQINRVYSYLATIDDIQLRIDSHVHTHMIPIVFDSAINALSRLNLLDKVGYIRVSKEPLGPFLKTEGVKGTFPLVNVIKNIILNILSGRVFAILKRLNIEGGLLWGLVMSGEMDVDRINKVSSSVFSYAQKLDLPIEVLCHPGIVLKEETSEEFGSLDMEFFFSDNRNVEYDAVLNRSI